MPTFSLNVANMGSHKHNNRTGYLPQHIDKSKLDNNVTLIDKPLIDVLHNVFDEELRCYNQGKKPSRQKHIEDIINDKKAIVEREIVGTFGDSDFRKQNEEQQKSMVLTYMKSFQERNPNLIVTQNILHADEQGAIHYHIRFVPIYHDDKRGMKIKVGMNKALAEMLHDTNDNKIFEKWRSQELNHAESIMKEHGQKLKEKNESRKHLDREIYIKQQQIKQSTIQIHKLDRKIKNRKEALTQLKNHFTSFVDKFKCYCRHHSITDENYHLLNEIQSLENENNRLKKEVFKLRVEKDIVPFTMQNENQRSL